MAWWPSSRIEFIAHRRLRNYAWIGETVWLLANEPNDYLPASSLRWRPPPKYRSVLCREASTLHVFLLITAGSFWGGKECTGSSTTCGFWVICASFKASASEIASWRVSSGEMSFPLNTFSFLTFHRYQRIHGARNSISSGTLYSFALHRMWSKLLKAEGLGKDPGVKCTLAKAQVWMDGGHPKSRWLTVSLSHPHRGQDLSWPQCRSTSLSHTGRQFAVACQRKCLILLEAFTFQTLALGPLVLGSE